jgi:hypothetical protein
MVLELGLNLERVQTNVRSADLEDLLDRATVYRNGMEQPALELIDAELRARGIDAGTVAAHWERRATTLYEANGLAVKCKRCVRPAVARRWSWHRLWGVLPVFPRRLAFCDQHLPAAWQEWPTVPNLDDAAAAFFPTADAPGSPMPDEAMMKKSEEVKRAPSE